MKLEKTFVMVKPDGLQRGLVGEVISRLEKKNLKLVGIKMIFFNDKLLEEHYSHLKDKPFFPRIRKFMTSTPLVAMVWKGIEAVRVVREMAGVTKARDAAPGTIRGDLGLSIQCNVVHASDSIETANKEIERFFKKSELFEWKPALLDNQYSGEELE